MKRGRRLAAVLDILEREEAAAARRLAEALRAEADARERLAQLQAYRQDYLQRGRQGGNGAALHNLSTFLGQLQAAIDQQQQLLHGLAGRSAAARHDWQQRRARSKALRTLLQRRRAAERQAAEHQAQRELDQWASRRASS